MHQVKNRKILVQLKITDKIHIYFNRLEANYFDSNKVNALISCNPNTEPFLHHIALLQPIIILIIIIIIF